MAKPSLVSIIQIIRNHKVIVKNTSYLTIIEAIKLILPFVALPYVIRTIGAENYGTIAFAQTIISYFAIFINFGLDISAVKDVSVNRANKYELNRIVSTVLSIKLMLFIASALLLIMGLICIPFFRQEKLLMLFCFLSCFSEIISPNWYYQGIEKMKYITVIRFISIIFYTSTVFIFVRNSDDYLYVPLLQSLGYIIAGLISMIILFRIEKIQLIRPRINEIKNCFIGSIPFFLSRVSVVINNGIAKIFSGIFFSMEVVGAFDLAQKIASTALVPIHMLNQAIYPHIAKTKSKNFIQRYFKIDIIISSVLAAVLLIVAPIAIKIFAGDTMPQAVSLLRILCLWVFFGGITTFIGTPVLVSFGYPKPFSHSVIYSTVALLGMYFLMGLFNIATIQLYAISLAISELVILIYRFYYCHKYNLLP